ncbi:MAG: sigma-70 family RNA polymerase sigma factor [bacterium]|nr:sigma-70 family RNA polymerase sigma factor [bacterium]
MSDSPKYSSGRRPAPKDELSLEKEWLDSALTDPEGFEFFYDKYSDRIGRFINVRTGDAELSRDLTALVFTKAISHLKDFQWQGFTLGSWLFRIATNEIRKHYARENQFHTVAGDGTQQLAPDPHSGQLDNLILTESQLFIFQCLHNLSERDQDIFILHYWEGQKTREVAETLQISENTVKTRLARGRDRLRSMMECRETATPESPDPDLRFAKWACDESAE